MNHRKPFRFTVGLALIFLLLAGCSSVVGTSTATPIPPSPTPGIGVPLTGGRWEVTITNVRKIDKWSNSTPKSDFIFLAVDATFHNSDSSQETTVEHNTVAVIGTDGKIVSAVGFGIPDNSHIDTLDGKKDGVSSITSGIGFVPSFGSKGDQLTATFVFVLPEDIAKKAIKFQFQEVQIPFSMK